MKIILHFTSRPHCSKILLNNITRFSRNQSVSHISGSPVKYFLSKNCNLQLFSRIFISTFQNFHKKHSYAVKTDDVDKLCQSILSGNSLSHENERTNDLKKAISFLKARGYTNKDIEEKFSDYLKSHDSLYIKLNILPEIDSNIEILLPLLSLPVSLLKLAADQAVSDQPLVKDFPNRISYLSYHLELQPDKLIPALAKHAALLTMNFVRLDNKMTILKNANIESKYILKDLWIFNYSEQLLASRIKAALKVGVELKPWMLRCSERTFESILLKYSETERILNGQDAHTYLANKLDCSKQYVEHMMEKNKLLKNINIPKLEKMINFLFEKGYTPEEIRLLPRIFCSSVKTLEQRFAELKRVKMTLPTLAELCLSKKKISSKLKLENQQNDK